MKNLLPQFVGSIRGGSAAMIMMIKDQGPILDGPQRGTLMDNIFLSANYKLN